MDAKQELDELLKNPRCYSILVNALGDYIGTLESLAERQVSDTEAAHFEHDIYFAEALRNVFHRWP